MPVNIYLMIIVAMLGTFLLVITFLAVFIRNQKALLRQREAAQLAAIEHQKSLLKAVVESQEEERKRIGKDLHDDVGTSLSTLKLTVNQILKEPQDEVQLERLKNTFKTFIDKIIYDVRTISHKLTPEILTIYTLAEALSELLLSLSRSGGMETVYDEDDIRELDVFTVHEATNVYRTIEELVNNTIRHSGATRIELSVAADAGTLYVDYRDNGRGLPQSAGKSKGRGMRNIESRLGLLNATFELVPVNSGYHARITIPKPIPVP